MVKNSLTLDHINRITHKVQVKDVLPWRCPPLQPKHRVLHFTDFVHKQQSYSNYTHQRMYICMHGSF